MEAAGSNSAAGLGCGYARCSASCCLSAADQRCGQQELGRCRSKRKGRGRTDFCGKGGDRLCFLCRLGGFELRVIVTAECRRVPATQYAISLELQGKQSR